MNVVQVLLIFLVTFVAGIDQFSLLESLYQPIVTGPVVGAILGDANTGFIVGGTYQLMTIGNMPVGGAQPPNAIIGGIMATVFAVSSGFDPEAAVGAAVPFALLGQYVVTLVFTFTSPLMAKADKMAEEADTDGIVKLNYLTMAIMGVLFGLVVSLFFILGSGIAKKITEITESKKWIWIMQGLKAAGGMMRYVGFATLLRVMASGENWGFYFIGFVIANIMGAANLGGSALLMIAAIGAGIAIYDYQTQVQIKKASEQGGGDVDGI